MGNPECDECGEREASFWVEESYLMPDGVGGVERLEQACAECARKAEPEGLREPIPDDYEFTVYPIGDPLY